MMKINNIDRQPAKQAALSSKHQGYGDTDTANTIWPLKPVAEGRV